MENCHFHTAHRIIISVHGLICFLPACFCHAICFLPLLFLAGGLITFGETALLVHPEDGSLAGKMYVARLVAHEIGPKRKTYAKHTQMRATNSRARCTDSVALSVFQIRHSVVFAVSLADIPTLFLLSLQRINGLEIL